MTRPMPGASAQAAYRRRRHQEREQWRDGWRCGRYVRWVWPLLAALTIVVLGLGALLA